MTFTAKNINDPQWTPGTYTFRISAIAGINLDVTASFDIELTMGCSVLKSELIWNVPQVETNTLIMRHYLPGWVDGANEYFPVHSSVANPVIETNVSC